MADRQCPLGHRDGTAQFGIPAFRQGQRVQGPDQSPGGDVVVDLERFAISGLFGPLLPGTPYPVVNDMFGELELDWPMTKRAPLFVKYGDIEFMFRFHRLTTA